VPEAGNSNIDTDTLFAPLAGEHHVLAAVSGGSDSLALLYLLHQWSRARSGPILSAATIDHGLRKEAHEEALKVGAICARLGIDHRIETWSGKKPESGVSQAARNARYRLLSMAANDAGASTIALGHTIEDQHETVLMRAERTGYSEFYRCPDMSTGRGLAGMRPQASYCGPPGFEPVRLFRPLLSLTRSELRQVLTGLGVGWIEDPSNDNLDFERIRMRRELATGTSEFPDAQSVYVFANQVAVLRAQLARDCSKLVARHVRFLPAGLVELSVGALNGAADNVSSYLLRVLISVAGGRPYLVPCAAAVELVARLRVNKSSKHTLGSAIIERRADKILLWREDRNLPKIAITDGFTDMAIAPGYLHLFSDRLNVREKVPGEPADQTEFNNVSGGLSIAYDGRIVYRFSKHHLDQELLMAPLGLAGVQYIEQVSGVRMGGPSRKALRTQPALILGGNPVFAPFSRWKKPGFDAPGFTRWSPAIEMFQADCDEDMVTAINNCRKA